jgi:hypothetical protein
MIINRQEESSRFISIHQISGEDEGETWLLSEMAEKVKLFLLSSKQCKAIHDGWLGWGTGRGAAAFLFEVVPASASADQLLWVIVGNLPPAYLVVDDETWIDAVDQGGSAHDCVPVIIPAIGENASVLRIRIDFIKQQYLADQRALAGGPPKSPLQ